MTTVCTADVSEVASSSGFTLTVSPMRDCSTFESTPTLRGAFSSSPTGNPALFCSGSSPTFAGGEPLGPPQLLSGDYVRRTQWVGGASYPLDHLVRTNGGLLPWCELGDTHAPYRRCDEPTGSPVPYSGAYNLTELHRTGPGVLSAVRGWILDYERNGECRGQASAPFSMSYRNAFARSRSQVTISYVPYTCTYTFEKL